jgi:hypothetical protein
VSYRFPGDQAKVRLAVEPKYQSTPIAPGTDMEMALIEKRQYEMGFGRVALPGLQGADVRATLVTTAQAGANAAGVDIGAIQDVRVDGHPAVWAHGTVKGDEADITVVYANATVYMLIVHTEDNSTDVQREFERSFEAGR